MAVMAQGLACVPALLSLPVGEMKKLKVTPALIVELVAPLLTVPTPFDAEKMSVLLAAAGLVPL